jgi:hypothetical protein
LLSRGILTCIFIRKVQISRIFYIFYSDSASALQAIANPMFQSGQRLLSLDETVGCFQAMGMNISFHPSANFKVVKLIEALDDAVGDEWAPLFAQVMHSPKLFAVFISGLVRGTVEQSNTRRRAVHLPFSPA